MSLTSAATGPRSSSGWARIAATTRVPPSSRGSCAEQRARSARACSANVGTPQPSIGDGTSAGGHAGGGGDLLEQLPLQRVRRRSR